MKGREKLLKTIACSAMVWLFIGFNLFLDLFSEHQLFISLLRLQKVITEHAILF